MGPINLDWIKQHGDNWAGGRIDMYGDALGPYGDEVGVPIMDGESWKLLTKWLDTYVTEDPDYNVIQTFQDRTGHKITFWQKDT